MVGTEGDTVTDTATGTGAYVERFGRSVVCGAACDRTDTAPDTDADTLCPQRVMRQVMQERC